MALRMTGMMSGMDTESIIQELVAVRRTKVDKEKKAQTKLNWKQEAWKDLNTKLKNLQTKYLSNMRFATSYSKKVTKVSNSNAVSVITGENAVNSVQTLKIKDLAKTAYLTGGKLEGKDDGEITALSKLSEIDGLNLTGDGSINIKTGDKSIDFKVTSDTTISDVLTQLKNAGLNASFDAKQKRFFISAKESGASNDFSITASDANGTKALEGLKLLSSGDNKTLAEYEKYASYYVAGNRADTLSNMKKMIDKDIDSQRDSLLKEYKDLKASSKTAEDLRDEIGRKYSDLGTVDECQTAVDDKKRAIESITDPEAKRAAEEELKELETRLADAKTLKTQEDNIAKYSARLTEIEDSIDVTVTQNADGEDVYEAEATEALKDQIRDQYYNKAEYAAEYVAGLDTDAEGNKVLPSSGATKVSGQDAVILLNGAEFTNATNTFEINGLTITALNETKEGEEITLTTEQDTDGIYDMVKNFLKEYNAIVNEMDKLYNAEVAKGYEPLTEDEKAAMSEKEVEEWEKKIKDSILRRDSSISDVNSALQSVMSSGISVGGKTMYLYDFGIETLGYFNSPDNEKHAYHIDGDSDDDYTSNKADKLKSMISKDPDTVVSFFTQLSRNLYAKMDSLSRSKDGYRSFGSFYDDKKLKSDYDSYTSKINDMEAKVNAYEDKWYSKFSKMETALAKMQSNASAITGLLGLGG